MVKRLNKKSKVLVVISSCLSICLIASAFFVNKLIANAQSVSLFTDFGGIMYNTDICCNGEEWYQSSVTENPAAEGEAMIDWPSIVTAEKGATTEIEDDYMSLGKGLSGGECLSFTSECESGDTVQIYVEGSLDGQIGSYPVDE